MNISDVSKVNPKRDQILVEIVKVLENKDGIYLGSTTGANEISLYKGIIRRVGPKVQELKVGQNVLFSEFAGYHVAIKDTGLFKIMDAFSVLATLEDNEEINDSNVTPTEDRVLVKVQSSLVDENGIILTGKAAQDPRLIDLSYATVLKTGLKATDTNIGETIAYEPPCGETVRPNISQKQPELKLLREVDILLNVTTKTKEL